MRKYQSYKDDKCDELNLLQLERRFISTETKKKISNSLAGKPWTATRRLAQHNKSNRRRSHGVS